MYALNLVDSFPDGDVSEYRYVDGEFIHDPLPKPEPQEPRWKRIRYLCW